jgi:hypothetical protein
MSRAAPRRGDTIKIGVGVDVGVGVAIVIVTHDAGAGTVAVAGRRSLVPGGGRICIWGKVVSIRRE